MVDRNSREESEMRRSILKNLPYVPVRDFKGDNIDEIQRRIGSLPCRFCGMPLAPLRDWGDSCVWRCFSIGCPNNVDQRMKLDVRELDTKMPNNPYRKWNDWIPRRLI